MLKRFKKKAVTRDALDSFKNNEAIQQIWQNSTTTREDFDAVYIPALYKIFNSVETDDEKGYLSHLTYALLVARNGIVMGKELPYEDAMRIKNAFTYALAMAPLLAGYAAAECRKTGFGNPGAYAIAICQSVLGDQGHAWLSRNNTVYFDFLNYFVDPKNSEIHAAIRLVIDNNPQIEEKRKRLGFAPIVFSGATRSRKAVTQPAVSNDPPPSPGKKRAAADDYLFWLETALNEGEVIANERDSFLHKLESGDYFLQLPDCFTAYCDQAGGTESTLKKGLRNKKYLRATGGIDYHFAVIDGEDEKGLVLKSQHLCASVVIGNSEYIQLRD